MLFKAKEKIRNLIICLFMAKRNYIEKEARTDFIPEEYKKKHIANSSIITMYKKEGCTLFFRECRKHISLKQYVFMCIEDYFDNICEYENKDLLKENIIAEISRKENYRKLVNITNVFNKHLLEILSGNYCDYASVGLECFSEVENNKVFIDFIKYISCVIISHDTNGYLRRGMYENFSANKQLATYKLSHLFGISDMIPKVWVCSFKEDGRTRVGTMMDKADGTSPAEIYPNERENYDKKTFLKDITNLEYFDAVCYQLDHRLDNYYVTRDENKKIKNVLAFDNDAVRTFFISGSVPKVNYAETTSVLADDGTIKRPYMDKDFADKILSVKVSDVKKCVGNHLSFLQMRGLVKRIKKLQNAVKKTVIQREDFLVSDWESVSPENELLSKWGKTYFSLYVNDTLFFDRQKLFKEMKK